MPLTHPPPPLHFHQVPLHPTPPHHTKALKQEQGHTAAAAAAAAAAAGGSTRPCSSRKGQACAHLDQRRGGKAGPQPIDVEVHHNGQHVGQWHADDPPAEQVQVRAHPLPPSASQHGAKHGVHAVACRGVCGGGQHKGGQRVSLAQCVCSSMCVMHVSMRLRVCVVSVTLAL